MTSESPTCFVIMPISVPKHLLGRYSERADHFTKIYSAVISPAIVGAGMTPLSPSRTGTENIQAAIINDLHDADLVLADLSGLNPNVFLELGMRSALDKPVCLVRDGFDSLPFDSGTLNTHKYDPAPMYELNAEIQKMGDFISATVSKSDGRNELWKFFGSASTSLPKAELDPEDASLHAKVDRLMEIVERQGTRSRRSAPAIVTAATNEQIDAAVEAVRDALLDAGDEGMHGRRFGESALAS